MAEYHPQGVPWSRGQDGTGQDVLPYLQQSHLEQGSHVCEHNPEGQDRGRPGLCHSHGSMLPGAQWCAS